MGDLREMLHRVADLIADYRETLPDQHVAPSLGRAAVRESLARELPDGPASLASVVDELVSRAMPGLMASAGPRYFGFVIGGSPDAAVAADLLTVGWDQCAYNEALSPAALAFEDVAGTWLKELLGLPASASVGFTTGGQGANTVGLAAGRWKVLEQVGWDVGRDGLGGAPRVRVVAGAERHATIDRSLRLLGLGESAITEIPALANGAMDTDALQVVLRRQPDMPTIVSAQAGNVNTGACDDLNAVTSAAAEVGAWVHVDGAFGLWAAANPGTKHLVAGIGAADSWACDGHKWLNVPYDSGFAFCAHPDVHAIAMEYTASYLTGQVAGRMFGGGDFVPESSRRARGFATWAALLALGRFGVADLIERSCALARYAAMLLERLDDVEVVNEVVLNQILVRVGDAELTSSVEQLIQADGTCWLGATTWRGERLLRISVSNWSTTERDIELTVDAVGRAQAEAVALRAEESTR
ncbi:aminotransferase class V-fold PLP-dependent enzyme [Gaiella sp.]|uniref:pyridoxal phosphate-dependent decarboxylase family protein n=1 Tax=Gaiella sp. TaxID=2663207 RepID=UPI003264D098